MKKVIIIPSRLASTRLPNKPLADICGLSMIVRVLKQAKKTDFDVFVACSEDEVKNEVESNGGNAILTDPDLPSGTDRIFSALESSGQDYDLIVNLQGDLPLVEPELISSLAEFAENSDFDIVTAVSPIVEESEKIDPNAVKAVVSWGASGDKGKALYFSRAAVPYGEGDLYHHIGIYVYKKNALEKFVSLAPSELEKRERLEQLRALENNMIIGVLKTDHIPVGVDTAEDLKKVREILSE